MILIIDTREQLPFQYKTCRWLKLEVGDYTSNLLLNKFHIERKSLEDLYQTITKGHLRFKKEIIRARHYGIEMEVFVEGTKADFEAKKFYGGPQRKISGETLIKILDTTSCRHLVTFRWFKNRKTCQKALIQKLIEVESKRHKKRSAINRP